MKNIVAIYRMVDCGFCRGTGLETRYFYTDHVRAPSERHPYTVLCTVCGGTGKVGTEVQPEKGQGNERASY